MKLQHITFTGIDAKTDIKALTEIQREFPIAEFGVLTSYHWNENGNRYLDPALVKNLRGQGLNLALHICGSAAHDAALGKWEYIDETIFAPSAPVGIELFKRVQLNLAERKDNPDYCWIPLIFGQELIVQQRAELELPLFENTLKKWKAKPFPHRDTISALLDSSGGRGIDTPLKVWPSSGKIGYAGGFNPDNVEEKLSFLMNHVTQGMFWIDMESGVRTDDWFDIDKVYKVLQICKPIIEKYKED
jgi:hypothetical protein